MESEDVFARVHIYLLRLEDEVITGVEFLAPCDVHCFEVQADGNHLRKSNTCDVGTAQIEFF